MAGPLRPSLSASTPRARRRKFACLMVAGHLLQRLNLNLAQWSTQNVSLALLSAFFHLHPHVWWLLYRDRLGE